MRLFVSIKAKTFRVNTILHFLVLSMCSLLSGRGAGLRVICTGTKFTLKEGGENDDRRRGSVKHEAQEEGGQDWMRNQTEERKQGKEVRVDFTA